MRVYGFQWKGFRGVSEAGLEVRGPGRRVCGGGHWNSGWGFSV